MTETDERIVTVFDYPPTGVGLPALEQLAYSQYPKPPPVQHSWKWAAKNAGRIVLGAVLVILVIVAMGIAILPLHYHSSATTVTALPTAVAPPGPADLGDTITPPGPTHLASVPDANHMIDPEPEGAPPTRSTDEQYLRDLVTLHLVITDRARVIETGHYVCDQMDNGYSMVQVAEGITGKGVPPMTPDVADAIVVAAVWNYCPEYKPPKYQH